MRVRIALAVSEDGHWCASGGGREAREMSAARENCQIAGRGSIACFWVKVEVPNVTPTRVLAASVEKEGEKP